MRLGQYLSVFDFSVQDWNTMGFLRSQGPQSVLRISCLGLVGFAVCWRAPLADEVQPKPIVSGNQLREALAQRRSVSYENGNLRKSLVDLQASTGICIVLDRRMDPSISVTLATPYLTNTQVISKIAQHVGASASFGKHFVLVGPRNSVAKLQTLNVVNQKAIQGLRRRLDSSVYRKLVESKSYAWHRLASPRQIMSKAAAGIGLKVMDADLIPHDLLAEARLPSTAFCDVATALLLQYDLTFEISDDGVLNFVPVPDSVAVEKKYRVIPRDQASLIKRWSAAFPELEIDGRGSFATIGTTVENHSVLQQLLNGKQQDSVAAAGLKTRLFTFKVPPGTRLGQVVDRFKASEIPIRFQGASPQEIKSLREQVVEIDMTGKLGTEFFGEVFKGTGATVLVSDTEVVLKF